MYVRERMVLLVKQRLLYFNLVSAESPEMLGVVKKMLAQMEAMSQYFDVYTTLFRRNEASIIPLETARKVMLKHWQYEMGGSSAQRFWYLWKLLTKVKKAGKLYYYVFRNGRIFDVVYIRYFVPSIVSVPVFMLLLKFLKPKVCVLEIPTCINNAEKELYGPKEGIRKAISRYVFRYWTKLLTNFADIIVTITHCNELYRNVIVASGNGIDLKNIPMRKNLAFLFDTVHSFKVIGVANVSFWHGYDRVIKGLFEYYKTNPSINVYFHIVGAGAELENLKKLTESLGLSEFVIFHGPKYGEELDRLFDEAHVAIGSLGNHRKGVRVSADLKTREYCARGIPFVISYDDVDFPNDFPYMLKVPADESPVDIEQILQFYERIKNRDIVKEMRDYAEKNLSWEAKLKPVIDEINRLLAERDKGKRDRG